MILLAHCLASSLALAAAAAPGDEASPSLVLEVADPARWIAEPSWLGNPSARHEVRRGEAGPVLAVAEAGRGMKWRFALPAEVPLDRFRWISIRCRAAGAIGAGDYLLALLGRPPEGPEAYAMPIGAEAVPAGGTFRRISGSLEKCRGWVLRGLALQVQAGGDPASLEIAEIRLSREPPAEAFGDLLPFSSRDGRAPAPGLEAIPLVAAAAPAGGALLPGLAGPFPRGSISAGGIPFEVLEGPRAAAATGLAEEGTLVLPLAGRASEVHLLLAARLDGDEEPVFGGGPLRELSGVGRSVFRLRYREGPPDEMVPFDAVAGRFALPGGPRHAVLFADPTRDLASVEVAEWSPAVALAVLAMTLAREAPGPFEAHRPRQERFDPPGLAVPEESGGPLPRGSIEAGRAVLEAGAVRLAVELRGLLPFALESRRTPALRLGPGSRLLAVVVDGREVDPGIWEVAAVFDGGARIRLESRLDAGGSDLLLRAEIEAGAGEIRWTAEVENRGGPAAVEIRSPAIEGLAIGDPGSDVLFYPRRGTVITDRPCAHAVAGSGLFPVQVLDLSAAAGGGLSIRTEDREGSDRVYEVAKGAGGTRMAVAYPPARLDRGQRRRIAPTVLGVHRGDWHVPFGAYRRWLSGWRVPRLPAKPWFLEVFNFRQRFLWFWDPIYEAPTGRFRIAEALAEAREAFGGLEFLHLMDWGTLPSVGRVYGRTGDLEPWAAWKGGEASFRAALDEARREGIPVGLYIEGYLLEERGTLGGGPGKAWRIAKEGGDPLFWPGATEMFMCPHVEAWREVQVDTYRRTFRRFGPRGFYIDQFGFADWGKRCWAPDHGHPIPASPLLGERRTTEAIASAVAAEDPDVAVYTEESPCDGANGFQDGSFTYAMSDARRVASEAPLNISRFAFPELKTFEILLCDQPTGSWAEGVLWTFWNGEGLWLEGPAREWFRPRTLAAIRRCHGILREHRQAFTTPTPEPLVPTLSRGLRANRFPGGGEVVYTLLNRLPRTFRGPALLLPPAEAVGVTDAWNGRPADLRPRPDGAVEVHVEIEPLGVGCIVVPR